MQDGDLDCVIAYDTLGGGTDVVFRNNGRGEFTVDTSTALSAAKSSQHVAMPVLADIDNDVRIYPELGLRTLD